ncbi:MAG TPA: thioether cross-link-forming SCIFF peptide maturase [Candidatus Eremiobacteraeota bacterium]|nr:MAG: Anaerobic sulfatase-maturating enzyme [bacterium ADurb.Bin363]HPZ06955.1 thioether cross-link-forming SCIFF peptide maturase [Candidatus Eremiobacteraeota bacterium]
MRKLDIHKFKIKDVKLLLDVNSGALHIIDDIIWDILDCSSNPLEENIFLYLKDRYEKSAIIEGQEELIKLKNKGLLFTPPHKFPTIHEVEFLPVKAICLHISHDCNLRCRYCFAKTGGFGRKRSHMSLEVAKSAIDFIADNSGSRRNLEIDFFGGEPLLNFDAVKSAIERAKEIEHEKDKNFRFTLTTNAVLLTDEIIDYLNEHNISLILSLDGPPEINDLMRVKPDGSGTYYEVLPKIKKAIFSREEKNYYIRGTYTKKSLNFSDTVIHLADEGFKNISLEPVVSSDKDYSIKKSDIPFLEREYEKLVEIYMERLKGGKTFNFFHFNMEIFRGPCLSRRLKGCGAGTEYMAVTPKGELYPCHQLVNYEDFLLGDIYNGIKRHDIRKTFHKTTIFEKENCPDCWARFFCSGGCYGNAYSMNKDIRIPDETGCALQKKRIECALAIQAMIKRDNIKWRGAFL